MDQLFDKGEALFDGNRERLITSISFGQKDGPLCEWIQSLPKGTFSIVVKDIIKAYISNTKYSLPIYSVKKPIIKKSITKSLSIGKEDYEIYQFLISIKKFNRANEIKKILWQYWKLDSINSPIELKKSVPRRQVNERGAIKNTKHSHMPPKDDTAALEDGLFSIVAEMNGSL